MCTFKISNYLDTDSVDKFLKLGGPSSSETLEINGIYLTHHSLSLTGEILPQIIQVDNLYFMLVGEIFDYNKSLPSELHHVIDMFQKHGMNNFINQLNGEFLVIIFDKSKNIIHFFTDTWSTRQVWFEQWDNKFYFGSLPRSEVPGRLLMVPAFYGIDNIVRLQANKHYIFGIDAQKLIFSRNEIYKWNLDQYKTSTNDFIAAFEQAVINTAHPNVILSFSGGLDSACIAVCLADHKKSFESVNLQFTDVEDLEARDQILNYCKDYTECKILTERIPITIDRSKLKLLGLHSDSLLQVSEYAKIINKNIMIQGNGPDNFMRRIMPEKFYEKDPTETEWPEDLKSIFPFESWYDGRNRRSIDKKETTMIHYGMTMRNPYFDKKLLQEWLNLDYRLKSNEQEVKGILKNYLRERGIKVPDTIAGGDSQFAENKPYNYQKNLKLWNRILRFRNRNKLQK